MQYVVSILILLIVVVAGVLFLNRPHYVVVDATLPPTFNDDGFSHESFEELLTEYVSAEGQVDYDRWHESRQSVAKLDSYLAAVSQISPDNAAGRYPDRSAELAYWIYAYNAYVIKSVLDHWPITSVTDIKAPVEAVKGLGFFHRLRFSFGGAYMSLLAVENKKIRDRYQDARVHFILNCASGSCPIMRPDTPIGDALEKLLSAATLEFIRDPQNVSVDHDNRQILLSRIFKWYEKDFVNELRANGLPTTGGLIDYVRSVAPAELAQELAAASDYDIVFRDYDWSLNASG